MLTLNLRTVDNGYIMDMVDRNDQSKTLVFTSLEAVTAWMNANYPVPNTQTLVSVKGVNRDNQIPVIKFIREYFGLGLREAKDKSDLAKDGNMVDVGELPRQIAEKFKNAVESATSASVRLE